MSGRPTAADIARLPLLPLSEQEREKYGLLPVPDPVAVNSRPLSSRERERYGVFSPDPPGERSWREILPVGSWLPPRWGTAALLLLHAAFILAAVWFRGS